MRKVNCATCVLVQVIGAAAWSLTDVEKRVVLHTLKRFAGMEYEFK